MSIPMSEAEFAQVVDDYAYNYADGEDEIAAECWQSLKAHDTALRARVGSLEVELAALREVEKAARAYVAAHAYMRAQLQSAEFAETFKSAAAGLDDALAAPDELRGGK